MNIRADALYATRAVLSGDVAEARRLSSGMLRDLKAVRRSLGKEEAA